MCSGHEWSAACKGERRQSKASGQARVVVYTCKGAVPSRSCACESQGAHPTLALHPHPHSTCHVLMLDVRPFADQVLNHLQATPEGMWMGSVAWEDPSRACCCTNLACALLMAKSNVQRRSRTSMCPWPAALVSALSPYAVRAEMLACR